MPRRKDPLQSARRTQREILQHSSANSAASVVCFFLACRFAALCILAAALVLGSAHKYYAWPHPETSAKTECASVSSALLGHSVGFCVVFPPGYEASSNKSYPTLYFLHGLFEDEHSWIDRGANKSGKVSPTRANSRISLWSCLLGDGPFT